MGNKEFEQIKNIREKSINTFLHTKLNKYDSNECMNLIYDYYTHFENKLQQQKAENEELRKKLGRPYVRRFDLENNKLKIENTQLKQQLEKSRKATQDAIDLGRKISEEKYKITQQLEVVEGIIEKIDEELEYGFEFIPNVKKLVKQALSQMQKVEEVKNGK